MFGNGGVAKCLQTRTGLLTMQQTENESPQTGPFSSFSVLHLPGSYIDNAGWQTSGHVWSEGGAEATV